MSWHDMALMAPLLSAWIEMLLIVLRIESGRSGALWAGILGTNWQGRLFCLTPHLEQNDPDQLAGSQFILGEMRMWGRILLKLEDILRCDEPNWEITLLFLFNVVFYKITCDTSKELCLLYYKAMMCRVALPIIYLVVSLNTFFYQFF